MQEMKTSYVAEWTLIKNVWKQDIKVTVEDGIITDISPSSFEDTVGEDNRLSDTVKLENQALMPGLINCHSHAFQRGLRGLGEVYQHDQEDSFWTWRQEMYSLVDAFGQDEHAFFVAVKNCFSEMIRAGITSVGEFHYFHHGDSDFKLDDLVLLAAHQVGIRIVLLEAFYCYGGFGEKPLSQAQKRFETASVGTFFEHIDSLKLLPGQTLGVVAHSLRAVTIEQLRELHAGAALRKLPFHLHIEEQPMEVEQCKLENDGRTPMRILLDSNCVDERTTAVHCNHTLVSELNEFVALGGNVCIAPLTEGNLGDGVMAELPVEAVCLGTDCNARIDMFEEMRWLEYSQRLKSLSRGICAVRTLGRDVCTGDALLSIGTVNGAKSLCLNAGVIAVGKVADFLTINLTAPALNVLNPETIQSRLSPTIVFGTGAAEIVQRVCVGGIWVH